jgi:glutamate/tyrosine decarboxylase-like PLP-dependent enzyme
MILPVTAHPAFYKAAQYFGLTPIRIPVMEDYRADISALEGALTKNTILLVGSAPSFPHGVVDPILEMGRVAEARGISLHVDACVGGFMLPFLRKLGYPVPEFDFQTPGVTSVSADLHKYAFGAKGASTILHRNADLYQYQGFTLRDYSMGTYSTETIAGTRPGGPIAAAWAVLHYLGEEGYLHLARTTMDLAQRMMREINAIPGLHVWGKPDMSVFAYGSHVFDIHRVADLLEARGWYVNRQAEPRAIHLVMTPVHERAMDAYLADVRSLAEIAARDAGQRAESEFTYYG